jgi:hypothetical protein
LQASPYSRKRGIVFLVVESFGHAGGGNLHLQIEEITQQAEDGIVKSLTSVRTTMSRVQFMVTA